MQPSLEAKIALRQIHHPSSFIRFTIWMTLMGVALGVASLLIVMAVMNGFESELQRHVMFSESHIIFYRYQRGIPQWKSWQKKIQNVDSSIQAVLAVTYHEVLFVHDGRTRGGVLEGVETQDDRMATLLRGNHFSKEGCIVGEELARELNLKKGDLLKVVLHFPGADQPPKIFSLIVDGTFSAGIYEYASRYVYAPLLVTQTHLGMKESVSAFKIKIRDPEEAKVMAHKIREQLSFPFYVRTWMDMNQNIFMAIKIEKIVMSVILAGLVMVALFNMMSSLFMIVIGKTKEIAIFKAMGMQRRQVMRIFLWQGGYIALLGTFAGVFIAFGMQMVLNYFHLIPLSGEVYYLSYLPAAWRWQEVMVISAVVIGACLGATVIPAKKASNLYPVDGLRYE
ncbi:MAG: ABC transporter permease [Deltaproteobacteria bacterium]|nr:ABC transporter permease [Deltaproteobacteria bacterium]